MASRPFILPSPVEVTSVLQTFQLPCSHFDGEIVPYDYILNGEQLHHSPVPQAHLEGLRAATYADAEISKINNPASRS